MKKSIQQQKDDESALRCLKCEKLLAKQKKSGRFEIKCLRCGTLNNTADQKIEQIVITDLFGRILFINKAAEKITGYKLEEAIGRKPSELWGGQMSRDFYKAMWSKLISKKEPVKVKMRNKNKKGKLYDLELVISPILDANKEVMFYIGIEVVVK